MLHRTKVLRFLERLRFVFMRGYLCCIQINKDRVFSGVGQAVAEEEKNGNGKKCFGILEKVFPVGKRGMREVPPGCTECIKRVDCMKAALASDQGIRFTEEMIERKESAGMIGWLERWSRKKELSRLKCRDRKGE